MITDALILSALTNEGATSLEVWKKIDQWSDTSIRNHLIRMAKAGIIDRYKRPIPTGFQWMFRLKQETPAS